MTIQELIRDLEQAASRLGPDAEVVLYDHTTKRTLRVDADNDVFDFEVLRGGGVVVEFSS